jgi:hypothetical protein
MGLLANSYSMLKYEGDDSDIKLLKQKTALRTATSSWNPEPTDDVTDSDHCIISKSSRRAGQRPRYFLYSSKITSGLITTTLYLKVAVLTTAVFVGTPEATITYNSQTYNFLKKVTEDND